MLNHRRLVVVFSCFSGGGWSFFVFIHLLRCVLSVVKPAARLVSAEQALLADSLLCYCKGGKLLKICKYDKTMSHLRATYFIRSVSIIALSVLLFSTAGIHFIHPFFHRHREQSSHCKALAGSKQSPPFVHNKHVEYKADRNCPICSFLKQFHIYKTKLCAFLPLLTSLPIFRFLFESVILEQIDYLLIPPRSPPCLFQK